MSSSDFWALHTCYLDIHTLNIDTHKINLENKILKTEQPPFLRHFILEYPESVARSQV